MATDLVGNTLSQSTPLGTVSGSLIRRERIGGTDRSDFYSFSLSSRSSFTTSLSNLRVNANLFLLNATGQTLAKSVNKSTFSEYINTSLESGVYYLRVGSRNKQSTGYKLTLSSAQDSSVNVLSPGAGNNLTSGNSTFITWDDNFSENVNIDLYKGESYYSTLFSSTASDGVEEWVIPTSLPNGSDYKIRISSTVNGAVYDESDGFFSITAPSSVVTVTSPNGGETLQAGSSYTINWVDNLSEDVGIYLYKAGNYYSTITTATASDGSELWSLPSNLAAGSDYQIVIDSTANANIYDYSNGYFTIAAPSTVAIASPNGGEVFEAGSIYTINWVDNLSENVAIDLYKGNSFFSSITSSTASDGSETWLLPSDLAPGSDYRIRITSTTNSSVFDYSDNTFTVMSTPTPSFDIVFDYRYDSTGWFTAERRGVLEAAAGVWRSLILDEFTNISVGTSLSVVNPVTFATESLKSDAVIDDLLIFVGGTNLGSGTLGFGGPSGTWFVGSELDTRYNGSDFEPWTGFISFNTATDWFFDPTPTTAGDIPFSQYDFLSVAIHEIGHVLGIGGSDAYDGWVSGGFFVGPNAQAQNGGSPIPLEYEAQDGSYPHIQEGYVYGSNEEAAMDPDISNGVRKLPTPLDIAILDDIGYSVQYPVS